MFKSSNYIIYVRKGTFNHFVTYEWYIVKGGFVAILKSYEISSFPVFM